MRLLQGRWGLARARGDNERTNNLMKKRAGREDVHLSLAL